MALGGYIAAVRRYVIQMPECKRVERVRMEFQQFLRIVEELAIVSQEADTQRGENDSLDVLRSFSCKPGQMQFPLARSQTLPDHLQDCMLCNVAQLAQTSFANPETHIFKQQGCRDG